MWRTLIFAMTVLALGPGSAAGEDGAAALEAAVSAMGAADLTSIRFSGSGASFAVGQSAQPGAPWPKFNLVSFTREIDYPTASVRDTLTRAQGEKPPRGGGGQPVVGEQRQVLAASGGYTWNEAGGNPVPTPVGLTEGAIQIWTTPHGVLQAALAHGAVVRSGSKGGRKTITFAFAEPGKFSVTAAINDQNLVEKVVSRVPNPVLGDMLVETTYSDYKDFDGLKFPTRIRQKQGGFAALELRVNEVQRNAAVDIQVPDSVREATVEVRTEKAAGGVWYLTGGTHHSVVVEMADHVVVVEGPQSDDRSVAVIAAAKRLVPDKPIRYVMNTHQHFDHAGGLRAFAAEGVTIITHEINKPVFNRANAAPRKLRPDRLAQSGKKVALRTVTDKMVLRDDTRAVEIHHLRGSTHDDGLIMVYLPNERLLIEADAYTPAPPDAPPPVRPNPFSVNLAENVARLKLDVDQILPLHGRIVRYAELLKAIGRT